MKDELETYLEYFDEVELVKECDGYFYNVHDMLKVFVIGLLCGLKNMHEIHEWANEETIFGFLENRFGITKLPSYYWFTCLLKTINIDSLNKCFMNLAHELIEQARTNSPNKANETTIAIDGKTIRSTDKMHDYDSPLHIVSALVAEQGITIAQKAIRGKTNEIPIVQELITELDIRGKTVVADALHCQKKTAQVIIEGKGDYLLSVKSNQPCLHQDIGEYVSDNKLRDAMNCNETSEKKSIFNMRQIGEHNFINDTPVDGVRRFDFYCRRRLYRYKRKDNRRFKLPVVSLEIITSLLSILQSLSISRLHKRQ